MADGLQGITVVQTATVLAGPMTARLLADWGAEVIRVERPARGDMSRQLAHAMVGGGPIPASIDYVSENINRNKKSISLDLATASGQKIMHRLLTRADVLLSNFRPRELEKFALAYDALSRLNPRLIVANLSGYGRKGSDKDLPGYEGISFFSRAGIMHTLQVPGQPPPQYPIGMGDFSTGLALAYGIMVALFVRERTGGGGWPWVPEMIGVARRHQNVYIDTESHRPKYLATPGSGWEMLLQFGNTLLQDRVLFASNWASYFQPADDVLKRVIAEMRELPLKEDVREKWLYRNAARLFDRE